jgi:NADP-dependent 3-hydroxy acid dehydrogenase YdfG
MMDQKMQVSQPRVWLITGTSSGFGMAIAQQALAAGDRLIATARDCKALEPLVASAPDMITALELDVTDQDQIARVVHDGLLWQGRIDVLVNNAGRGEVGAAEQTTDKEL